MIQTTILHRDFHAENAEIKGCAIFDLRFSANFMFLRAFSRFLAVLDGETQSHALAEYAQVFGSFCRCRRSCAAERHKVR